MSDVPEIGPTGEYPTGRPEHPGDKGGLRAKLSIDRQSGRLLLEFGKKVAWLAMTGPEALALADELRRLAARLAE